MQRSRRLHRTLKISLGVAIAWFALFGCASAPSVTTEAGVSPFISLVHLQGFDLDDVTSAQYTIAAKPGSVSKPVHVEYSVAALAARGYVSSTSLTVPVVGLYAGYQNQVSLVVERATAEAISLPITIQTAPYVDSSGIYSEPNIVISRSAGSTLGFDFIFIKSGLGSPVVIDTDAQIRWAVPGIYNSISSTFRDDEFVIGDEGQPTVYQLRLDGNLTHGQLPSGTITEFHHDINYGKQGLLGEVNAASGGVVILESNIIEFQTTSPIVVPNNWDLGAILSAFMSSQGDNPAAFVRPGVDWFHSNSAIYDQSDDSVIVSSRENFVIKLDYKTGTIKWILGDPTKYWFTFPSLRAKALTLAPGGLYPIGQHGLSITSDGLLMLFNDGLGSSNQPAGEPAGETRSFSAVSAYLIDEGSMTAMEVWDYSAGQSIYSPICSSAYEAANQSILVDYAVADNFAKALLVGLDSNHNPVFEFEYPNPAGCDTSWNARPIPFDDLRIDQ